MPKYKNNFNLFPMLVGWVTPILFFPIFGRNDSFTCKFVFLILVSLFYLYALFQYPMKKTHLGLKEAPVQWLKIYWILLLISTIFSMDPLMSIFGYTSRLNGLITLALYVLVYFMGRGARGLKDGFFYGIAFSSWIVSLFVLSQALGYRPYSQLIYTQVRFTQAVGTMGNRNFLGSFLVLTLPISLYLSLEKKKYFFLLPFLCQITALAISQSRGPWLGSILAGTLWIILAYHRGKLNKKKILYLLLVLSILLLGLVFFGDYLGIAILKRFSSIFHDISSVFSKGLNASKAGSHRIFVWKKSLQIVRRYPLFGVGIENMQTAMRRFYYADVVREIGHYLNYNEAHNEYLHIAVCTGIPSLLVYLVFLWKNLKIGLKKIKDPLYEMLFICIFAYLVQAFFNISVVNLAYLFWLFLGLFSGNHTLWTVEDEKKESSFS